MKKLILFLFTLLIAVVISAQDIDSLVKEGEDNYSRKNYKTAYDKFKAAMKVNPNHPEASKWYWKMKKEHDIANLTDSNLPAADSGKTAVEKTSDSRTVTDKTSQTTTAEKTPALNKTEYQRKVTSEAERLKLNELDRKLAKIQTIVSSLNDRPVKTFPAEEKPVKKESRSSEILNIYYILPIALMSLLILMILILVIMLKSRRKKFGDFRGVPAPVIDETYLLDMNGNRIPGSAPYGHRDAMLLSSPSAGNDRMMITQGHGSAQGELESSDPDFYKFESFANGYVYLLEKKYKRGENTRKIKAIANEIGIQLGMSREDILELRIVAILRDIGFLMIPESVILKNGALSKTESLEVFRHPLYSSEMMKSMNMPERVVQSVIFHHERYDGSGYPNGIAGSEIPLFARIVGLCESYISLISDKPYKSAISSTQAVEILRNERHLFDPEILKIMFAIVNETA